MQYKAQNQIDINCSSLPAGLGGNGEFERKFEGIREEISQNEVSLGGSPKGGTNQTMLDVGSPTKTQFLFQT